VQTIVSYLNFYILSSHLKKKKIIICFLEHIALVVGGSGTSVELYSPSGNCNHQLADFPVSSENPVLVYVDEMIIACAVGQSCWEYNTKEDKWSVIAKALFTHNGQPGVVYQEKVYVIDEASPQVFDPSSKTWSSWPSLPNKFGNYPCIVNWKDCIILFGGSSNTRSFQIFNITAQTWTVLDTSQLPMEIHWSSSLTLNNGNVFIVGSEQSGSHYSAAFYKPTDNSWVQLEDSVTSHQGTRLVQLGTRLFAIGGRANDLVEEYNLETNLWTPFDVELLVKRDGHHSVLALPANLFSHLPGGCQGVL
jgi:hypothetical protein